MPAAPARPWEGGAVQSTRSIGFPRCRSQMQIANSVGLTARNHAVVQLQGVIQIQISGVSPEIAALLQAADTWDTHHFCSMCCLVMCCLVSI